MFKKIIILLLLIVPLFAGAMTQEEILDKINVLEKEALQLRNLLSEDCHKANPFSWDYCSIDCPCGKGQGDCDNHLECETGYCAYDVGSKYGQLKTLDICEEKEPEIVFTEILVNNPTAIKEAPKDNSVAIKGRILDENGSIVFNDLVDKNGKFIIKTSLNEDIEIGAEEYLDFSLFLCENCQGYQKSVLLSLFDQRVKVFPVFNNEVDIGDVVMRKANDLSIYSDRIVKVVIEYKDSQGKTKEIYNNPSFSHQHDLKDIVPLNYDFRVVLIDKTNNYYSSLFQKNKTSLSFVAGQFVFGVCENGICEKEENTCFSDCVTDTTNCTFGVLDEECKKDIILSFPNNKYYFEQGKRYLIEWGQIGLAEEDIDLELFAYNEEGDLINDFSYIIATSVKAVLGEYEWETPKITNYPQYKIVVYNKMCLGGNQTLVQCLGDRYLDKSNDYFSFKKKEPTMVEAKLASIAIAASALADLVKDLLQIP